MTYPTHPTGPGDPSASDPIGAVDLDHDLCDDPHASAEDRALDVQLARLFGERLLAVELPVSRVDLELAKRRAVVSRTRQRRRTTWLVGGLAAAAAVVVSAGSAGLVDLVGPDHGAPAAPGDPSGGGGGPVPLRPGVPALPADVTARLDALTDDGTLGMGTYRPLPISSTTTEVGCDEAGAELGVVPAVLEGLDARGFDQVCAVSAASDGSAASVARPAAPAAGASGAGGRDTVVYRFYLPPGAELDRVTFSSATGAGVSWTQVELTPSRAGGSVSQQVLPDAASSRTTTVPRGDGVASVRREGPRSTSVSWVEPYIAAGSSGGETVAVTAVVATTPVGAVRAALGFVNQGGMQVQEGEDGSLLLVPSSPPVFSMQALGGGRLTRTPEGCLGLDDAGGFQLVLWPYGTTWDPAAQSLTVPGAGVVWLGQDVQLGGGEGGSLAPLGLLPAGCVSEKTWISSSPL